MSTIDQRLSKRFADWEQRGRGWQVFPEPVALEPAFAPFPLPEKVHVEFDDGRRPTFLSSLIRRATGQSPVANVSDQPGAEDDLLPESFARSEIAELSVFLPSEIKISPEDFSAFLASLALCAEPIAFELIGTYTAIRAQFAGSPDDLTIVRKQLGLFFPDIAAQESPEESTLSNLWSDATEFETAIVEFGLNREFLRPLAEPSGDPFLGVIGALSELGPDESAVFQILFHPALAPWADSIIASVTRPNGSPFFVNAPELTAAAQAKTSAPFYATVVRVAVMTEDFDRTWALAQNLALPLRVFAHPDGNEFIPLRNDKYPLEQHISDLCLRQSCRSGMLLNREELLGFLHLPDAKVYPPKFQRLTRKTKSAPDSVNHDSGIFLGWNQHLGAQKGVWLTPEQRVRHTHIIGKSGTGKSTLLFNLIAQDIAAGGGVAVLDPHGDLVDRILGIVPESRIDDVILLDATDEEYSVGFNILSAHSEFEKTLLASDLVSVFQRLSSSWGDQMGSVLHKAILVFLESPRGGTLADLRRFLLEPAYRDKFLLTVRDPDLVYYWKKGFAQLSGNKSIGSVLTRLEMFLTPKPIRHMVSQPTNRLDFEKILDSGKIFLAKLAHSAGKENSYLLGSLLLAKFQQTVMTRQRVQESERRDFWLYVDEFQNFITPSLVEILSGARKYRVGLTLAHHELHQLQRDKDVESAVMTHCHTRVCFRVGDQDARELCNGFSTFEARDLQNLEIGEAICRVESSGADFNLTVPLPEKGDPSMMRTRREQCVAASRAKYAMRRSEVEDLLYRKPQPGSDEDGPPPEAEPKPRPKPVPPYVPPPAASLVSTPVNQPEEPKAPPVAAVPLVKSIAPVPSPDAGSGIVHNAIRERLITAATEMGFQTTKECTVNGGSQRVDLVLFRGESRIACEIPSTNTVDYEVGNVGKCLKENFVLVAVVGSSALKLKRIEEAALASFGAEASARVRFFSPDEMIAHLRTIPLPVVAAAAVKIKFGRKVKSNVATKSPEEIKALEAQRIAAIAAAMKPKPPSK